MKLKGLLIKMTNTFRRWALVVALCVLIALAGCDENGHWSIRIDNIDIEQEDDYLLTGNVTMGGFINEVEVEATRLVLTSEAGETLDSIHIGNMNGSSRSNVPFEHRTESIPRCVFIEYDSIEDPENADPEISVYVSTEEGYGSLERTIDNYPESCRAVMDAYRENHDVEW